MKKLEKIILRLTHKLWNRQISRILSRAYQERIISSAQLHELAAAFDPTQRHIVYGDRVIRGFKGVGGVFPEGSREAALYWDEGDMTTGVPGQKPRPRTYPSIEQPKEM